MAQRKRRNGENNRTLTFRLNPIPNPNPNPNPNLNPNPISDSKPNPKRLFSPLRCLRCAEYRPSPWQLLRVPSAADLSAAPNVFHLSRILPVIYSA